MDMDIVEEELAVSVTDLKSHMTLKRGTGDGMGMTKPLVQEKDRRNSQQKEKASVCGRPFSQTCLVIHKSLIFNKTSGKPLSYSVSSSLNLPGSMLAFHSWWTFYRCQTMHRRVWRSYLPCDATVLLFFLLMGNLQYRVAAQMEVLTFFFLFS